VAEVDRDLSPESVPTVLLAKINDPVDPLSVEDQVPHILTADFLNLRKYVRSVVGLVTTQKLVDFARGLAIIVRLISHPQSMKQPSMSNFRQNLL
jgi:hypothetical protein